MNDDINYNFGRIQQPIKKINIIKRNELCPCGSGKKYKKCCMIKENDLYNLNNTYIHQK